MAFQAVGVMLSVPLWRPISFFRVRRYSRAWRGGSGPRRIRWRLQGEIVQVNEKMQRNRWPKAWWKRWERAESLR